MRGVCGVESQPCMTWAMRLQAEENIQKRKFYLETHHHSVARMCTHLYVVSLCCSFGEPSCREHTHLMPSP